MAPVILLREPRRAPRFQCTTMFCGHIIIENVVSALAVSLHVYYTPTFTQQLLLQPACFTTWYFSIHQNQKQCKPYLEVSLLGSLL